MTAGTLALCNGGAEDGSIVAEPAPRFTARSRRNYPRVKAGDSRRYEENAALGNGARARGTDDEELGRFLGRTVPREDWEQPFEHPTDKRPTDRTGMGEGGASTIRIAPPEMKLEITLRDTRATKGLLPTTQQEPELHKTLTSTRPFGVSPPRPFASEYVPPQTIPKAVQDAEDQFLNVLETSLGQQRTTTPRKELWDQYSKRAEEFLITMSLEKLLRVLRCFTLANYADPGIYLQVSAELAKEIPGASATRLCQVLHWVARAGLRDPTLMALVGNEIVLRNSQEFLTDMYIEILNAHAKLDVRAPRLVTAILRELMPRFADFSRDQCQACAPLMVVQVLTEPARNAYLARCAELQVALPASMTKPAVLRQFRLLEVCLRFDYHPTQLPDGVAEWLEALRIDADSFDVVEPAPLAVAERDIFRVMTEEMDLDLGGDAADPVLQDGIFTLHLVMGKVAFELLDSRQDYFVTPNWATQKLLRAETKLRHRLLWRRGWKLVMIQKDEWEKLTDDLYKKDLLYQALDDARKHKYMI